ncbi:RTA1-like protein, partial [Coniophora puteana RWD-64-598 SS2]
PYHYVPTEWICILFVVLYSISTVLHLGQSVKYRLWWLLPTVVLAGAIEIMGWSARLWSSKSPRLLEPYEIQLVGTILAPTPLVAGNFIILGNIVKLLGTRYSRLPPNWFAIVFCSFDVICLIIQAVGGASAAAAVGQGRNPEKNMSKSYQGGNVMLGGIVAQMIAIALYVACAGEFFLRYFSDSPVRIESSETTVRGGRLNQKMKYMIVGLTFATTCIFIRSVYRTIELANGFAGPIISTQVYFNVLDGAMITLSIYTINIAHPGFLLTKQVENMALQGKESKV